MFSPKNKQKILLQKARPLALQVGCLIVYKEICGSYAIGVQPTQID